MKRWLWLIPLLAGALAYAPAPWGQLVWDDAVVADYQLESFHTLGDVLQPPADIVRWSYGYYRPVVVLSYLADARLFGPGAAAGPHIVNVLLHLLATFGVWLLAGRVLGSRPGAGPGALVAATVFAVHPIHTEAVSWIAGRSDVLATMFLMPALLLALRWRDGRSIAALLLSPLCYLLALLSKETGITALALVPLTLALAPRDAPAAAGGRSALRWGAIALGYLAVTALYWWLRQLAGIPEGELKEMSATDRLQRLLAALAYYIGKVFVPWPQSAIVPWEAVPGPAASGAILVMAAVLVAACARRWWRQAEGAALLAAAWFCAAITVALWAAVDALSNTPLAERHLYLPSVGMVLGVGLLFAAAWAAGRRAGAGLATAVLVGAYLAGSIARGFVWHDDLALWTDATRGRAVDGLAWTNLGVTQLARDQDDLATQSFRRAIASPGLEPKWASMARNGLGLVALRSNNPERAEEEFRAAITAFNELAAPYYNLGQLYIQRTEQFQAEGDFAARDGAADVAINYLATASRRFPAYSPTRLLLVRFLLRYGQMLEQQGRNDSALRRYQAGIDQLQREPALLLPRLRPGLPDGRLGGEADLDPAQLREQFAAGIERLRATAMPRPG